MPKLRVSVVEFLNTAPLVWGLVEGPLRGKYELSFTVPSLCAEALRRGEADVAIIPSIEYQRMEGMVALPGMSIAAKSEVKSILVLSRGPVEKARRFALDARSRSSAALVRLLCARRWRIQPEFFEASPDAAARLEDCDAALLIGDRALRISLEEETAPPVEALFLYDVASEWRAMTGKPCVLAFWAARRQAATTELVADFQASKDYGLGRLPEIAARAAEKLGLPAEDLEGYLRESIDFSLDEENQEGLAVYYQLCAEAGLIPRARELEFAGGTARAQAT